MIGIKFLVYEIPHKIDLFFESIMNRMTTGKLVEDLYFSIRYFCFRILADLDFKWLTFNHKVEEQLRPHNKQLNPQYTLTERFGIGLKRPVLLFILPFLVTIFLTFVFNFPLLVSTESSLLNNSITFLEGYLKTIATITTTLSAFLLTVIAITIQVKTSYFTGAHFLINALIRKRGFIPIAALLFGTIVTALLGIAFSSRFSLKTLNDYVCATLMISFCSLLLLFDLLRRTMQTLGTLELEQLLSADLTSSLRISFRDALRQGLFEKKFSEGLADLGFARLYTTEKQEKHPIEYKLERFGKIIAVDPAPLRRISHILKLNPILRDRNISSVLIYRPEDNAPYITIQPTGNITEKNCLALLTNEEMPNKQIKKLIRKSFIIKKIYSSKLDWQILRQVISSAIIKLDITTVTTVTNAIIETFEDYLDAQREIAGQGNLVLEDFIGDIVYGFKPPHPYKLRLSNLIVLAARNRSQDCLDELLNCIYKMLQISLDKQNEKYFHDWIFELYWAYYSFNLSDKDGNFNIASDITRRVHWLSNIFQTELFKYEESIEKIEKLSPYAIIFLSLCLHMLKRAVEKNDQNTFDSVMEHITQFLKREIKENKSEIDFYRELVQNKQSNNLTKSEENKRKLKLLLTYDYLYNYKNLLYVVLGSWIMYRVKDNKLQIDKVSTYIEKIINNVGNFRSLLDLYSMPNMADFTTSHDNPLGFDNWDWPHSPYPKTRMGSDFGIWIKPFYQFLLLKKAIKQYPSKIKLENIPQTRMANHNSLKEFLKQIKSDDFILQSDYLEKPWSIEPQDINIAKENIEKVLLYWQSKQEQETPDNPK